MSAELPPNAQIEAFQVAHLGFEKVRIHESSVKMLMSKPPKLGNAYIHVMHDCPGSEGLDIPSIIVRPACMTYLIRLF